MNLCSYSIVLILPNKSVLTFRDKVSGSLGWPRTHCVAEDGLVLLIFLLCPVGTRFTGVRHYSLLLSVTSIEIFIPQIQELLALKKKLLSPSIVGTRDQT